MSKSLTKLAVPLAPLLDPLPLSPEALHLLSGAQDAAQGLEKLIAAKKIEDAIRLVSRALPKREAVWWCCMCARSVPLPNPDAADIEALNAAEAWVRRPSEEARRASMLASQKTPHHKPANYLIPVS